jgi:hypothetical protein
MLKGTHVYMLIADEKRVKILAGRVFEHFQKNINLVHEVGPCSYGTDIEQQANYFQDTPIQQMVGKKG